MRRMHPPSTQLGQIRNRYQIMFKRLKLSLFVLIFMAFFLVQVLLSKNYSRRFIASRSEQSPVTKIHHPPPILEGRYAPESSFVNAVHSPGNVSLEKAIQETTNSTTNNHHSNGSSAILEHAPVIGSSDHSTTQKQSLCTREQIRRGHWKPLQLQKPPYVSEEPWESTCYRRNGSREGQLEELPFRDWEWTVDDETEKDNGCLFAPFDVDSFCELNSNRTVAFLGDSLTWQQFNSLNLLLDANDEIREKALIKTDACNESTKLIWMRDNYATAAGMDRIIQISDPDVIVFNRGAHFTNNSILAMELNATLARSLKWQQECQERNDKQDCLLVWRTTAPGFPDCDSVPGPISALNQSMAEALISNPSNPWCEANPKRQEFHWWDFAEQNELAEHLIQNQRDTNPLFRISFIDFYEMAILRPDNHIGKQDCLHWCLPGPPDAANAVLLHEMKVAASKE